MMDPDTVNAVQDLITFVMDGRAADWLSAPIATVGEARARRGAAMIVTWLATWDIGRMNPMDVGSVERETEIAAVAHANAQISDLVLVRDRLLTFASGVAEGLQFSVRDYVRQHYRAKLSRVLYVHRPC